MKKAAATFVILTFLVSNSIAQPNGGFENWSTEFSFENPDDWQTFNFLAILGPPNPLSAFKVIGFDKHSGDYALMLKSIFVNNNPMPGNIPDTLGCVFKGKVELSPVSFSVGFPYTGRPEKLEFYSKYLPVGNDSGLARVTLRKRNGLAYDTIGKGELTISSSPFYSLCELNITYYSTEQPDSAIIAFFSSKDSTTARVGSTLFLDDVGFIGWVGIDEKNEYANKVNVFPNPAKGNLTITTEIKEAENVKILDVAGKLVGLFKIQNFNASINVSLFTQGIYFYEILDTKEKVLTNGKFNVVK
ncbi:MAG: T9SS type A sorting domain-containing protein [Bacteroidota bacterium]|nr:T9SS type A sorting domain-containing protein [Bacteroidota bacterium]